MKCILLLGLLTILTDSVTAQEISRHRWTERVVLLAADDPTIPAFLQQLNILANDQDGLEERKIIVYQLFPTGYRTGVDTSAPLKKRDFFPSQSDSESFTILLYGLDGGIKLERHAVVTLEELFSLIDSMPMRRAELGDE